MLGTVDMLGEWDLELTLLRRAVQQDAQRIELPVELVTSGRLVRIDTRTDAERRVSALSQSGFAGEGARDALSTLLAPVGRHIVSGLRPLEVRPEQLGWGAGLFAVFGIAAASADWPRVALMLALVAEAALSLHGGSAQVMLRRALRSGCKCWSRAPAWPCSA